MIREITHDKGRICRAILGDLPAWFGIPQSVDAYVAEVETLPMFGWFEGGEAVGFIALKRHNRFAAEAFVLGIKRAWHRRGIGRQLFAHARQFLAADGCLYLTVKTVAQDDPDAPYARTRRFYEAIGFVPVEIFPTLWSPANPCLLMILALRSITTLSDCSDEAATRIER